jgi:hypothetical protein
VSRFAPIPAPYYDTLPYHSLIAMELIEHGLKPQSKINLSSFYIA